MWLAGGDAHGGVLGAAYLLLRTVNWRLERVFATLAGFCLAIFTAVVLIDVIYRQVLKQPLLWPSEWSVIAFIWSVMLAGSVAARRRSHFVVELLPHLRGGWNIALRLLVASATLVLALVLLLYGWEMTALGMRRFTPMMGYPLFWVYSAFPVAGVAFALFALEHLCGILLGTDRGDSLPEEAQ